ncbi:MAG: IS6 family transposase [SAR202 cluster bacterium]|nr:IS6 family transposase [SAR202 cluster bacterium]
MKISPQEKIKYCQYPKLIIYLCVYYYHRYALSYRDIEEIMIDRGINVDHSTVQEWVVKYTKLFEKNIHKKKRNTDKSWRMDETYIKVKGKWKYLYRAVDKYGNTIDFLLTAKRNTKAALRFLNRAIKNNGMPEKITIDGSDANNAAIESINKGFKKEDKITIRKTKYLNNIIEQDHRGIKKICKPMLGFKNFHSAQKVLRGIEVVKIIRKKQIPASENQTNFETFCSLAA